VLALGSSCTLVVAVSSCACGKAGAIIGMSLSLRVRHCDKVMRRSLASECEDVAVMLGH
jgi:hypothetical protein